MLRMAAASPDDGQMFWNTKCFCFLPTLFIWEILRNYDMFLDSLEMAEVSLLQILGLSFIRLQRL